MFRYSLYYSLRSFIRGIVRGGIIREYYYNIIKKNEYSLDNLNTYVDNRFKKLSFSLSNKPNRYTKKNLIVNFPIISKKDVQNNLDSFYSKFYKSIFTNYNKTSGTTGSPLRIKQSLECVQLEEAFTYRQMKWSGYKLFDRIAWIRGDIVVPPSQKEPPFWCMDYVTNKLMMSSYHISNINAKNYIHKLEIFDPVIIQAYPSSIYNLAIWLKTNKLMYRGRKLKSIITSSEVVTSNMKDVIEEVFRCKLYDWYGQAERVAAIGTCEEGEKHLLTDYSYVELGASFNNKSEIIGTSLNNMIMPLVRYATGDYMVVNNEINKCKCGRVFPVVKEICGRQDKPIVLQDGTKIHFLDHAFKDIPKLLESQVLHFPMDKFLVKIVVNKDFEDKYEQVIIDNLRKRLGNVEISIEKCNKIDRGRNGKFEFIKVIK